MPKESTTKPKENEDLRKELSALRIILWKTPISIWCIVNVVGIFFFILALIVDEDLVPAWCDTWSKISLILVGLFAIRIYIKFKALKKYLPALEHQKFEEAVSHGREYYSIKRKGFLGMDGHGYNYDDDDAIAKDIQQFSDN